MTTGASQYKAQSDDRAGIYRLTFGIALIAFGFGCLMAVLPSFGSVFDSFRNMVRGIAGIYAVSLPILFFATGVLLCVSSQRRISMRGYWILLAVYLCVMAILTLLTPMINGENLMDYGFSQLGNNNTTWGSFIRFAYQKPNYSSSGLGAGALGMFLAYPLFGIFRIAGSVAFLSLTVIFLSIWLFRIDLTRLFHQVTARTPGASDEHPPQYAHKTKRVRSRAASPTPVDKPAEEQFIQENPPDSIPSDDAYLYLVPEDAQVEQGPAGFVPVQAGMLYEQHITDTQSRQPQYAAGMQPGREPYAREPVAAVNPSKKPGQYTGSAQKENHAATNGARHRRRSENNRNGSREEILDIPDNKNSHRPSVDADDGKTETSAMSSGIPVIPDITLPLAEVELKPNPGQFPVMLHNPGIQPDERPIPVHTDPAVILTGERISISTKSNKTGAVSISAVPEKTKQLEIAYYEKPPIRLLNDPPEKEHMDTSQEDNAAAERLEQTLSSFNISAEVKHITHGPAVTRFAIRLAEGINVRRITSLVDNIALEMKTMGVRTEVPIPGTSLVGIEVRNKKVSLVTLREVLDSPEMSAMPSPMTVSLGKDIMGTPVLCNLSDMPHLLIAGATGSGKSVCINSIITSILYRATPRQVRLIMIDPKMVELQPYNGIPHLLLPVVSDLKKAAAALDWAVQEMKERYEKLQTIGARNITNYNQMIGPGDDQMPYIVLIIDELSDLMTVCKKSVEESIMRLASLARAAGICLVLATQRPSVDVITGVIKANIPSRIAFAVSSYVDSRTIIDGGGAEKLAGSGDMLYAPRTELKPRRVQGCFISDNEVSTVTKYVIGRYRADYDLGIMDHLENNEPQPDQLADEPAGDSTRDEFWEDAIEMAIESGQMSISMLQRRLRIGYARAGRLIDEMARYGIISTSEGSKSRKTLLTREDYKKKQTEGF